MSGVVNSTEAASGQRRWRVPTVGMLFISAVVLILLSIGLTVFVPHWRKLQLLDHLERSDPLSHVTTEYRGPEWLAGRFGEGERELFAVVTDVTAWGADDATLQLAATQPSLTKLRLCGGRANAQSLQIFSTHLTDLELLLTTIDDDALAGLEGHDSLERLRLISCNEIEGTGFEHLRRLPHLNVLDSSFCPITDEGLWHIAWLEQLVKLDLRGTSITNAGLRHLERLTKLAQLNVSGTAVGDEGIEALARIPALKQLKATAGQFTDQGRGLLYQLRPDIILATE